MCIYVCRTCSSGPANVAYVCECVHRLIHVVRSLRHFKLRSWVRVRFRLFALVAGKQTPSWKELWSCLTEKSFISKG